MENLKKTNYKTIPLKLVYLIFLNVFFLYSSSHLSAQTTPLCENAQPFCSDASNPTFPNQTNTDIPIGPDYGCLQRDKGINDVDGMINPQWFYFQVSQSGDIELEVTQEDNLGNGIDLDFVMWGPFSNLEDGCSQVMNGYSPLQCSSDPSAKETIGLGVQGGGNFWANFPFVNAIDGTSTPPQAQLGEVYIVMLTNSDGSSGTISLEQTSGTGATDCSIITPCEINITTIPSGCDSATNTYSVSGEITFTDEPTTGTLIVEDCNGNTTSFSAPFSSPLNYTITGIQANGNTCDVTAYFSDETLCSSTVVYQSPETCNCAKPNIFIDDLTICSNEGSANLNDAISSSSDAATSTFYASQVDADNGTNVINPNVTTANSYWIRAEDPSAPDCYTVMEIQVTLTTLTYTASITDENCAMTNGEITLTPNGGTTPYTYSIDNGLTTQGSGTFSGLSANNYTIEITDNNNCKVIGTENIKNIGGVDIDLIIPKNPSCAEACDGEIEIEVSNGTSPYTFTWLDENNTQIGTNSPIITGLCEGDYSVEVTDGTGLCPTSTIITLIDPNKTDASFTFNNFCEGESNNPSHIATPGGTFSFNPAVSDGATIDASTGEIFNGVGGTTYFVEYTTLGPCTESSTQQVTVFEKPISNFTADPQTTETPITDITFTNQSIGGNTYEWNFGDGSPIENSYHTSHEYSNIAPESYLVTLIVTSNVGCVDSSSINIVINSKELETKYDIPNVFTPNNDLTNDNFKLINPQNIKELEICILNRWGNIVFESQSINFKWNGELNNSGKLCSDGTYFYKLKVKTINGNEEIKQGFVQLSSGK